MIPMILTDTVMDILEITALLWIYGEENNKQTIFHHPHHKDTVNYWEDHYYKENNKQMYFSFN